MATTTQTKITPEELISEKTYKRAIRFEKVRQALKDAIRELNVSESRWSASFNYQDKFAEDFAQVEELLQVRADAIRQLTMCRNAFESMVENGYADDAEALTEARWKSDQINRGQEAR
jgi:hypothetical protein